MSHHKSEPAKELDQVRSFRSEIDRVFDDFFRPLASWGKEGAARQPLTFSFPAVDASFIPSVDVKDTGEGYLVTAELPGFTREEVELTLTENSLSLKGEHREEKERKEEAYFMREISSGSFRRVIGLPGPIDTDKVSARMKDGVLTVTLAKSDKPKKLDISIGD